MAFAQVPQVTATINIASPNITNAPISLNVTSKLSKAGTTDSIDQIDGVNRKYYGSAQTNTLLIAAASFDNAGAHKVYIKNTSSTATDYVEIQLGASNTVAGKLYGGDWAFFPWDGVNDIDISTGGALTIEYAIFYQTV